MAGNEGLLQGREVDTITPATINPNDSTLTLASSSNTTTSLSLTYSGGTVNRDYFQKVKITFTDGNSESITVKVEVREPE